MLLKICQVCAFIQHVQKECVQAPVFTGNLGTVNLPFNCTFEQFLSRAVCIFVNEQILLLIHKFVLRTIIYRFLDVCEHSSEVPPGSFMNGSSQGF